MVAVEQLFCVCSDSSIVDICATFSVNMKFALYGFVIWTVASATVHCATASDRVRVPIGESVDVTKRSLGDAALERATQVRLIENQEEKKDK